MPHNDQPDPANPTTPTPAWSRDLAEVASSPFWGDWRDTAGTLRRDTFIEQALEYATYEDMPGDLKATYDAAYRVKQAAISQHQQQRHSEHREHRHRGH